MSATRLNMGNKICLTCGVSYSRRETEGHEHFRNRQFCSCACIWVGRKHKSEAIEKIRKAKIGTVCPWKKGKLNYFWRGGVTPILISERMSSKYKQWRTKIFERDDYTCVWCGERGGKLNADHIKSFARFPKLRYKLNNGRTLCVPCHRKTDTFAGKSRT